MEQFIIRLIMYIERWPVLIPKRCHLDWNYVTKLNKYGNPKANVYTSLKSLIFPKNNSQKFTIVFFYSSFTLGASVGLLDQQSYNIERGVTRRKNWRSSAVWKKRKDHTLVKWRCYFVLRNNNFCPNKPSVWDNFHFFF